MSLLTKHLGRLRPEKVAVSQRQLDVQEHTGRAQNAEALGKAFFDSIGYLPDSMDRTYARQFAEDALAHVTKIREELDDDT